MIRHNAVATPNILNGFENAVQHILADLTVINNLDELKNSPIKPYGSSLISHYNRMSSYFLDPKAMDDITASKESQTIVCTPEEAFSPTNRQIFEQHIKEIVVERKSAVLSGPQSDASTLRFVTFLKELAAQESSTIQLERSYIFTEMDLLKPDSVFSLVANHVTNGTFSHPIKFIITIPN